eukprot:jgi/Bigna1/134882/aug1.27_g9590
MLIRDVVAGFVVTAAAAAAKAAAARLRVEMMAGKMKPKDQKEVLAADGIDVLISTPKSAMDLVNARNGLGISVDRLAAVVVDEADQLIFAAATMSRETWDEELKPILSKAGRNSSLPLRRVSSSGLHKVPPQLQQSFVNFHVAEAGRRGQEEASPKGENNDAVGGEQETRLAALWNVLEEELGSFLTVSWSPNMDLAPIDEIYEEEEELQLEAASDNTEATEAEDGLVPAIEDIPIDEAGEGKEEGSEGDAEQFRALSQVLVFTNSIADAEVVASYLKRRGAFSVGVFHGKVGRGGEVLDRYNNGALRILVCTDAAARGLDFEGVTHVVQYQMPLGEDVRVAR